MPTKQMSLRFGAVSLSVLTVLCAQIRGQEKTESFWLAGRYDGNRIVVYFNKVQFRGTMSSQAREIAPPVADLFITPVELPASYIAAFQKKPGAEHFAIGDRYDLMLGNGTIATIKVTALVGCETDEEVGNDSFVGALATVEKPSTLLFTHGYYAVRRHQLPQREQAKPRPKTAAEYLRYRPRRQANPIRHRGPNRSVARSTDENASYRRRATLGRKRRARFETATLPDCQR